MKFELNIIGMTCANCSGAIERVTKKIEGVCDARVDFNSGVGRFEIDNTGENPALNTDEIRQNVEKKIKKLGSAILRKIIASNLQSKQKLDCQQNRVQ